MRSTQSASPRPLDPDFGPRGRSPIEREKVVEADSYLRFLASGALCCSAAHLFLTPIDVVKTKLQTAPTVYTNPVQAFKKVVEDNGFTGFFQGWAPTFAGYFFWGGVSYPLTEFARRFIINDVVGTLNAAQYEIPIILLAAGSGAFVACFAISPFESIRIRMVSQPDFAPNIFAATNRIIAQVNVGGCGEASICTIKRRTSALTRESIQLSTFNSQRCIYKFHRREPFPFGVPSLSSF